MHSSFVLVHCFLAATCARRIAHEATGKTHHANTGIPAFAPGMSSFAPGLGFAQKHGALKFHPGLKVGHRLPQFNPSGAAGTRPARRSPATLTPRMNLDGEVTASSIFDAWSASNSIPLQSTVYRKVFRKVDDVFKSWMDLHPTTGQDRWLGEDKESAMRAMEALQGPKEMDPLDAELQRNFQKRLLEDTPDEVREAIESIMNRAEDEHPGPDHHIFGLAYGDSAPEHVLAVAKAETTFERDDNLVMTMAAIKQHLTASLSSAVHDDLSEGCETIVCTDIEVVYVTDLIAKPTASQKETSGELLLAIIDWARLQGKLVAAFPENQEMFEYYKQLGFESINPLVHDRMIYNGDRDGEIATTRHEYNLDRYKQLGFDLHNPELHERKISNGGSEGEIARGDNPEASQGPPKKALLLDFVG